MPRSPAQRRAGAAAAPAASARRRASDRRTAAQQLLVGQTGPRQGGARRDPMGPRASRRMRGGRRRCRGHTCEADSARDELRGASLTRALARCLLAMRPCARRSAARPSSAWASSRSAQPSINPFASGRCARKREWPRAVVRAGERAADGRHHVRVAAEVGGCEHGVTEILCRAKTSVAAARAADALCAALAVDRAACSGPRRSRARRRGPPGCRAWPGRRAPRAAPGPARGRPRAPAAPGRWCGRPRRPGLRRPPLRKEVHHHRRHARQRFGFQRLGVV